IGNVAFPLSLTCGGSARPFPGDVPPRATEKTIPDGLEKDDDAREVHARTRSTRPGAPGGPIDRATRQSPVPESDDARRRYRVHDRKSARREWQVRPADPSGRIDRRRAVYLGNQTDI